jgi:hypothetical protein
VHLGFLGEFPASPFGMEADMGCSTPSLAMSKTTRVALDGQHNASFAAYRAYSAVTARRSEVKPARARRRCECPWRAARACRRMHQHEHEILILAWPAHPVVARRPTNHEHLPTALIGDDEIFTTSLRRGTSALVVTLVQAAPRRSSSAAANQQSGSNWRLPGPPTASLLIS